MYLRRNSKTRSEVSFDEPLNIDWDGNELLLSDVLGTENDTIYRNIEEQVDRKLLQKALEKLSERERLIMELRFGLRGEKKKRKRMWPICWVFPNPIFRVWKKELSSGCARSLTRWCKHKSARNKMPDRGDNVQ